MKLKSLDTANDYGDFTLPIMTLDKITGKGVWREGADVFVQMHNEFRQEFSEEKTTVEWESEAGLNPCGDYFDIDIESVKIKEAGLYAVSVHLLIKGETGTNVQVEVTQNNAAFGMRTAAAINDSGLLGVHLKRVLKIENTETTLRVSLRKAAGAIQLPYAASLWHIEKLKI